jgi:hypothetical protein
MPLLATHLSFREIAEKLHVSRNTIKTQAISVYREARRVEPTATPSQRPFGSDCATATTSGWAA